MKPLLLGLALAFIAAVAAATPIQVSHPQPWHPEEFGAVGDGIADDTGALQACEATNDCQPTRGKRYKTLTTLTIGNGTGPATSTAAGSFSGPDDGPGIFSPLCQLNGGACNTQPTLPVIDFHGTNAPAIKVQGPVNGVRVSNLKIDCNSGVGTIGLEVVSAQHSGGHEVQISNCASVGYLSTTTALNPSSSISANSQFNHWTDVEVDVPAIDGAIGWKNTSLVGTCVCDTDYQEADDITIVVAGAMGVTQHGFIEQVSDSNHCVNCKVVLATAAVGTVYPLTFDYSVASTFPTSDDYDHFEANGALLQPIRNIGPPGAAARANHLTQLVLANGSTYPALPNLIVDGLVGLGLDARAWGAQCNGSAPDDSAAINSATVAAATAAKRAMLPAGVCLITHSLVLQQGVVLAGQGGYGSGVCRTTIQWNASGGDMVTAEAANGSQLIGPGLEDVCLQAVDGGNVAARALVLKGVQQGQFHRIAIYNPTTRGVLQDVSGSAATAADQLNEFSDILIAIPSGYGWEIGSNGGVGGLLDEASNSYKRITIEPSGTGRGFFCGLADGNHFTDMYILGGGLTPSFEAMGGTVAGNPGCRENVFDGESVFQQGFLADNGTYPSKGNVIASYKVGDGETYPTIQAGADASITTSTGAPAFVFTVATLPACSAANKGTQRYVSDASSPTYLGALTGGSSTFAGARCNGSAWVAD